MMTGYPKDVEDLIFCKDKGIYNHLKPGSYVIDHSTNIPSLAVRLHEELGKVGVHSIDAPVTGGDIGAKNGCLSIMMGGDKEPCDHVQQLMECYGRDFAYFGGPGTGQHCKAAN